MKQNKAVSIIGGVKRIRPVFFGTAAIMLFMVIVIDTRTTSLVVPGVFAGLNNATNYLVKIEFRNYLNNRSRNISLVASGIYNMLANSTSRYSRLPILKSEPVIGEFYNNTKQRNGISKENSYVKNDVKDEYNNTSINSTGRNDTNDKVIIQHGQTSPVTISATGTHIRKPISKMTGLTTKLLNKQINLHQNRIPFNQSCTQAYKSRHLMTVGVVGRIGNELFQVCTLIATADDACYTAFLPRNQKIHIDSIFDVKNVSRTDVNTSKFQIIGERGWAIYHRPIVKVVNPLKNVLLSGYLQTFKHFQHKKELVKSSLVFKQQVVSDVLSFFSNESLQNKTKVGIHVRRGDFLGKGLMKLGYFAPSKGFILRAINHFTRNITNKELAFIIVSDKIKWCKENIKSNNVYYSPFTDPGRDLNILTQCDHNVVSSGTFGWMGAWLNETGTVVYDKTFPRHKSILWHGHRKEDYYPSWWVGL